MNVRNTAIVLVGALLMLVARAHGQVPLAGSSLNRAMISMDADWTFHLGDVAGAEQPEFADDAWRKLDVPHDYMIEGAFDRRSPGGGGNGFLDGGVGWYRKAFTVPESAKGQRSIVLFDGVYMDADVYLNGVKLGNHPYGYTSFSYDLTPNLKYGNEKNVLAVRCNVQQPCSRWYSGAGIYRHVWLMNVDAVHVPVWGSYVTTPEVTDAAAKVVARTRVQNDGGTAQKASLVTVVLDPAGKEVAAETSPEQDIAAGKEAEVSQTMNIANPERWNMDSPKLYTVVTRVKVGDKMVDTYTTPIGVRTIAFTADNGFLLNGKRVQIQGVCDHHDLGCLGAAVNTRGLQRQLEILRGFGVNAIRTSHNPPAPELLDLCDRMGFVVMDESFDEWKDGKTRMGYGRFFDDWSERDMLSMLQRDRNHPSIVMWSIGNEIPEQGAQNGGAMAQRLADFCRREDPTRFVTAARNNPANADRTGFSKALDVLGINYNPAFYQREKGQPLVGSETSSALSSRGEYNLVINAQGQVQIQPQSKTTVQCTSYDLLWPGWGHSAETSLKNVKANPWVAGEFVWTGFDYIGEPTPYPWPARSSYFGIVDMCGFAKDRTYLYKSQWTREPVVHILPSWNWGKEFEGKEIPVWVFNNADSVELFLNGKSLGEKTWEGVTDLHLTWKVPYMPGILKAVGKKNGKVFAEDTVVTAGAPAKIEFTADRAALAADGQDLSFLTVRVLDKDGNICPNADNLVKFSIEGPGAIVGTDNGNEIDLMSFKVPEHKAFHGMALCVVQVKGAGDIKVRASSEGLPDSRVILTAK